MIFQLFFILDLRYGTSISNILFSSFSCYCTKESVFSSGFIKFDYCVLTPTLFSRGTSIAISFGFSSIICFYGISSGGFIFESFRMKFFDIGTSVSSLDLSISFDYYICYCYACRDVHSSFFLSSDLTGGLTFVLS